MKAALGKARIAKEDVLSYVESLKAAPTPKAEPTPSAPAAEAAAPATQAAVNEIPVRGRRRAIAQKMSESTSTKPRVTHMMDVDLEEDVYKRQEVRCSSGHRRSCSRRYCKLRLPLDFLNL